MLQRLCSVLSVTGLCLVICSPHAIAVDDAAPPKKAGPPPTTAERLPIPAPAAQAAAEKLIRDLLKDDYAKLGVLDHWALAQKLLLQTKQTGNEGDTKYVLFREALRCAVEASDPMTATAAIDGLSTHFVADPVALKLESYGKLSRLTLENDDQRLLANGYFTLVDQAVAADNWDAARKAATAGAASALKTNDQALSAQARALDKNLADRQKDTAAYKAAQQTLAQKPDDPAANLAAGKFICVYRGDWEKGLPLLAQGSDAKWKEPAVADLGNRDESTLASVADKWQALAAKLSGVEADAVRTRAAAWYQKALTHASALDKIRIERLLQSTPSGAAPAKTTNEGFRRAMPADQDIATAASDYLAHKDARYMNMIGRFTREKARWKPDEFRVVFELWSNLCKATGYYAFFKENGISMRYGGPDVAEDFQCAYVAAAPAPDQFVERMLAFPVANVHGTIMDFCHRNTRYFPNLLTQARFCDRLKGRGVDAQKTTEYKNMLLEGKEASPKDVRW